MDALGADFTIACPAFPDNGRTVFQGHLFVGDQLLSRERHARPPADADDRRQPGARAAGAVRGRAASACCVGTRPSRDRRSTRRSARASTRLRADGVRIADRRRDRQRRPACASARRCADLPLVMRRLGPRDRPAAQLRGIAPSARGGAAAARSTGARRRLRELLDGDQRAGRGVPAQPAARRVAVDPLAAGRRRRRRRARRWPGPSAAARRRTAGADLRAPRRRRRSTRRRRARRRATPARCVERCSPAIADGLVARGVRRLVVAGGETSGACVQALGVAALAHRPRRSIPACPGAMPRRRGRDGLQLALKSGNFGSVDFFAKAFARWRMSEAANCATRSAASAARSSRARLRARARPATSAPACDDGFLITPTDACLGFLDPARARQGRRAGRAGRRRAGRARRWRCTAASTPRDRRGRLRRSTRTRTHLVALTLAGVLERRDDRCRRSRRTS